MAQISKLSRRYRTKEEICQDIAFVLDAPLHYGTKFAVIADAAWVWTEFHGKYVGCQYWTGLALAVYQRDGKKAKLKHEHVVPRRVVTKMLFALDKPTPEAVREICERFLIGMVVTPEEDKVLSVYFSKDMPPEFYDPSSPDYLDPWLRYRRHPEIRFTEVHRPSTGDEPLSSEST